MCVYVQNQDSRQGKLPKCIYVNTSLTFAKSSFVWPCPSAGCRTHLGVALVGSGLNALAIGKVRMCCWCNDKKRFGNHSQSTEKVLKVESPSRIAVIIIVIIIIIIMTLARRRSKHYESILSSRPLADAA